MCLKVISPRSEAILSENLDVEATVKGHTVRFDVHELREIMKVPTAGYENYVK